jgi:hypothetical protein
LLVIDGNAARRVFHIRSSVVAISGLTITNGYSAYGGGGCEQNSTAFITASCLLYPSPIRSRFFEIARVLVRPDYVASVIGNADHSIM